MTPVDWQFLKNESPVPGFVSGLEMDMLEKLLAASKRMETRSVSIEVANLRNREAVAACSRGREPTESRRIQIESREAAAAKSVRLIAGTPSGFIEFEGFRSAG